MFIHFMVNSPTRWNNKIEKPRLLIYLFCGGFMFLMYSFKSPATDLHFLLSLIRIITFILAFILVHYTWTSKFKNHFNPPKNNKKKPSRNNFNIAISKDQLNTLYKELVRYEMVDETKTDSKDFIKVFLEDWDSHGSKVYFDLDGPSSREFYELFSKTFPNNSLTLKKFFETSRLIIRPDGKRYMYNTIKNAGSKTEFSKRTSDLLKVFSKFP